MVIGRINIKTVFSGALLFVSLVTCAQFQSTKISLAASYHYHHFYDSGVYELGSTNDATARGVSLQGRYAIRKNLNIGLGYHFSVLDDLSINGFTADDNIFHQIDFDLEWKPFNLWKLEPFIYSGYGIKVIPALASNGINRSGVGLNLGSGVDLPVSDWASVRYQMNYNFSLADQIPYFFRHQWGIVINPTSLGARFKSKAPLIQPEEVSVPIENKTQNVLADDLERVSIEKAALKARTMDLENDISLLEEENQLLLEEIRSKRYFSDSIFSHSLEGYTVIDSLGKVLRVDLETLKSGFYLLSHSVSTLKDARIEMTKWESFELVPIILNRSNSFFLVAFLAGNESDSQEKYRAFGRKRYLYSIIRL